MIASDDDDENMGMGSTRSGKSPPSGPNSSDRKIELARGEDGRRVVGAKRVREAQGHRASVARDVKGKGKAVEDALMGAGDTSSDFDFDGMVVDEAFLEGLDRAEMEALGKGAETAPALASTIGSGTLRRGSFESSDGGGSWGMVPADVEVITIDDGEEDEKENVPVPTRNVRATGPSASERRPVILADSDDVIDISDSDSD